MDTAKRKPCRGAYPICPKEGRQPTSLRRLQGLKYDHREESTPAATDHGDLGSALRGEVLHEA